MRLPGCCFAVVLVIACSGQQPAARIEHVRVTPGVRPERPSLYASLVTKRVAAKRELDAVKAELSRILGRDMPLPQSRTLGGQAQRKLREQLRALEHLDDRERMHALLEQDRREFLSRGSQLLDRLQRALQSYDDAIRIECTIYPLAPVCRTN